MAKKNFNSLDSLKTVENVINDASDALKDPNRTIVDSSISTVLGAMTGGAVGGAASFAALYGLGVSGLSAAGITSGLATAGAVFGGGMAAGVFVLAAPVAILSIAGYGIAESRRQNKLKEERQRLYTLALQKHQAIINALKQEASASKERMDYLQKLNILLQKAIQDLKADMGL